MKKLRSNAKHISDKKKLKQKKRTKKVKHSRLANLNTTANVRFTPFQQPGCPLNSISTLLTLDPHVMDLVFTPDRKAINNIAALPCIKDHECLPIHLAWELLGLVPESTVFEVLDIIDPMRSEYFYKARISMTTPVDDCNCPFCSNRPKNMLPITISKQGECSFFYNELLAIGVSPGEYPDAKNLKSASLSCLKM